MSFLNGSPYLIPSEEGNREIGLVLDELTVRVSALRAAGKLNESTLRDYYGETRFEQIAQSNALEGSTLSAGETELAVLKGITISGHDPGFSKDAQSLARALDELTELAKIKDPTDINQVKRLHELILAGRSAAGAFRREEVRIGGSEHQPPRTWEEVMTQMEHWETWSRDHRDSPPLLRASVLHAWLEHIHPFADGNGRAGRAITNLELVRAGYPPIIIRRKDRDQYLEALRLADGGDLGPFLEIIGDRLEDALRDLERAAKRRQGFDSLLERRRLTQSARLDLWNAGVHLLFASIRSYLADALAEQGEEIYMKEYDTLQVDDFIDLCEGHQVSRAWVFVIRVRVPGMPLVERLAWSSTCGKQIEAELGKEAFRPVLKWSIPNPEGFPRWIPAGNSSPGGEEMTIVRDGWWILKNQSVLKLSPSELAANIAQDILDMIIPEPSL